MFDLQRLEDELFCLDLVPETFLPALIVNSRSGLSNRVSGLLAWRQALLRGEMPPDGLLWPDDTIAKPLLQTLQELCLPHYTRDNEEITDRLLADLLQHLQESENILWERFQQELEEIEQAEHDKRELWEQKQKAWKKKKKGKLTKAPKSRSQEELEAEAKRLSLQDWKRNADVLASIWSPRVRVWAQLADVFGELGELLGLGWDLSIGLLNHHSWTELLRLHELLKVLPQLKEVIRALGRLHCGDSENNVARQIIEKMIRIEEEVAKAWVPIIPHEARGITRSAEITRMLPSESSLLLHPTLRMVWHARRAEHALLTYKFEGEEIFTSQREVVYETEKEIHEKGKTERGPMIVCLDTSGSMSGVPEVIAKALTLEAMRVAHKEDRKCYLYAFSGPSQITEHELSLAPEGLASLLTFLQTSFSGGTDVDGPVQQAILKLKKEEWKLADVLLVSDGEFPVSGELQKEVDKARKEKNARFFGVQVGSLGRTGLHKICDTVHLFADWKKIAPLV